MVPAGIGVVLHCTNYVVNNVVSVLFGITNCNNVDAQPGQPCYQVAVLLISTGIFDIACFLLFARQLTLSEFILRAEKNASFQKLSYLASVLTYCFMFTKANSVSV